MSFKSAMMFKPSKSSKPLKPAKNLLLVPALVALAFAGGAWAESSSEQAFMADNKSSMNKMMSDMAIKPTGDIDKDFVHMMVPHHQGAIDMARAELRYGHNETLRRIAQEIIVSQMQEIPAMKRAIGEPLPPSAPSPTQSGPAPTSHATPQDSMPMSPSMNMSK
ncbi:MAG TPA: DUF305 domain-containing protein [Pseudolabrys sp.]